MKLPDITAEMFYDRVLEELVSLHMCGVAFEPMLTPLDAAQLFRERDSRGRIVRMSSNAALSGLQLMVKANLLESSDGRAFRLPTLPRNQGARLDYFDAMKAAV